MSVNLTCPCSPSPPVLYCTIEKRRPNGHFFLGFQFEAWPPGGCTLPAHQSLPFSHQSQWNIGEQKLFLRGVLKFRTSLWMPGTPSLLVASLALDPWRTGRVLERSLGVQDDHMDANRISSSSLLLSTHTQQQPRRTRLVTLIIARSPTVS